MPADQGLSPVAPLEVILQSDGRRPAPGRVELFEVQQKLMHAALLHGGEEQGVLRRLSNFACFLDVVFAHQDGIRQK